MKRYLILVLAIVLILSSTACSTTVPKKVAGEGLTIYTSFYPMYFLASRIAGDKAQVTSLVPAGVEPHDWEPKPKTLAALQESDMFIYNGAGMETWAEGILPSIEKSGVKIVNASNGLALLAFDEEEGEEEHEEGDGHDHESGEFDPHVWVSPAKYREQAGNILAALIEADSANKEYYQANYNSLAAELEKLDNDFKQAITPLPNKVIVVSHDAFGYLAKEYGLTQMAIRGVTPEAEPSPAKLAELVDICRKNNVKYIFFESLVSPKLSQTLANEVGAEVLVLNDGQGISEDEIKAGKNYITIMYENLENLKKALGQ